MRLVFFGDSFTFGQGFPDCLTDDLARALYNNTTDDLKHSILNWPTMVAEQLGVAYVNKSIPGSSNAEIFYKMRSFEFDKDDIVVVQWSFSNRDMVISEQGRERIGPWEQTKISERYFKVHCDYDMNYRSDLIIEHAALWLKQPYLFLSNDRYHRPVDDMISDVMMRYKVDALPDSHPGERTNQHWANAVIELLHTGNSSIVLPTVFE